MRPFGLILIAVAFLVPLAPFWTLAGAHDPVAVFSQYLGASALIAMGISQLLATRWPGLEFIFGGLDRMYILHKWLGIGALAAILLHDTIDADMDGLGRETALVEVAETFGEISLYGFLILASITVVTFVPYQLWHLTHKFMGGFFAMSAVHFMFILKPFQVADPLGLYILGFCGLGIVCYLYTLLPQRFFRGRHRYRVESARQTGGAVAVTLTPVGRGLSHRAGQFAFVRFDAPGLGETHPFTISNPPDDRRTIRFTIKPLGDFTDRLRRGLNRGTVANISPAFGHFKAGRSRGPQIWIAGGIGITPFAAMAGALEPGHGPVHVFTCVSDRASAAHIDELETIAAADPAFTVHLVESETDGRLTAERISRELDSSLAEASALFCGPKPMREALRRDLVRRGLKPSTFAYEEFEIRSGIGVRRLVGWLFGRALNWARRRAERPAPS